MRKESTWVSEVGRWTGVVAGIMGIAAFILLLIFGLVTGIAYLVEVFYR